MTTYEQYLLINNLSFYLCIQVDSGTLEFELALRKVLETNDQELPSGLKSYANVHRSFGDISTGRVPILGYFCHF